MASTDIYAKDINGNSSYLNMIDLKLQKLNHWENWYCGIGIENFHICEDGTIMGSVCNAGSNLGNIYKDLTLNYEPTKCPFKICHCGSDMYIPKAKEKAYFDLHKPQNTTNEEVNKNNIIFFDGNKQFRDQNKIVIDWSSGKRCNFDCSYCPAEVHNKTSPHIPLEDFNRATENLNKFILDGKKIRITFTGGEPTLNPNFLDFVKNLKNKYGESVRILTNTNGSRNKDYLNELNKYSALYYSIHTEFADLDKVYEKVNYLANIRRKEMRTTTDNFIILKVMVKPDKLTDLKKLYLRLTKIKLAWNDFIVHFEPLVDKGDNYKMYNYTQQQLDLIQHINNHDQLLTSQYFKNPNEPNTRSSADNIKLSNKIKQSQSKFDEVFSTC